MSSVNTKLLFQDVPNRSEYRTYVETGVALGGSIESACRNESFNKLFTIELSPQLYKKAMERIIKNFTPVTIKSGTNTATTLEFCHKGQNKTLTFILGNSKIELPKLLKELPEKAVILLDAHYCKGDIAEWTAKFEFPLWDELYNLKLRNKDDIVIVDDEHTFGKLRKDLADGGLEEGWMNVTEQNILEYMGDHVVRSIKIGDSFALFLKESREEAKPWSSEKTNDGNVMSASSVH